MTPSHAEPGCLGRQKQVQALRAVEPYLGLDALYVLGTNCVDNGPREGLDKFLRAASSDPDTVLHYEFMQARAPCMLHAARAHFMMPMPCFHAPICCRYPACNSLACYYALCSYARHHGWSWRSEVLLFGPRATKRCVPI